MSLGEHVSGHALFAKTHVMSVRRPPSPGPARSTGLAERRGARMPGARSAAPATVGRVAHGRT